MAPRRPDAGQSRHTNARHWRVWYAIPASVAIGVIIGAINGFVVVKPRVSSFIATLGADSILSAVLIIITNSAQPQLATSKAWTELTQSVGGRIRDRRPLSPDPCRAGVVVPRIHPGWAVHPRHR
jgi:ribose/xylose/arabinose/galactoside ABC-type transport system permease subunit